MGLPPSSLLEPSPYPAVLLTAMKRPGTPEALAQSLPFICMLFLLSAAPPAPLPQPPRLCSHVAPCVAMGRLHGRSASIPPLPSPLPPPLLLPPHWTCVGQCSGGRHDSPVSHHSSQAPEGGPRDHSHHDGNICPCQPLRLPGSLLHGSTAASLTDSLPHRQPDLEMCPPRRRSRSPPMPSAVSSPWH